MSLPQLRQTAAHLVQDKNTSSELKKFSLALLGATDETLTQFTLAYLGLPANTQIKKVKKPGKGSEGKKEKDPNAPKRPLSAYFAFANDKRAELVAANPDAKFKEMSKLLGQAWKDLDEKTKNKYKAEADERMAQWKKDKDAAKIEVLSEDEDLDVPAKKSEGKKEPSLAASSMEIVDDLEEDEVPPPPKKPAVKKGNKK